MRTHPFRPIIAGVALLAAGTFTGAAVMAGRAPQAAVSGPVLLVTNKAENTVSFVDPATRAELARVPSGRSPHEIAVTPEGRWAFVANYGESSLTVVDVRAMRADGRVDLGPHSRPHGIVVAPDGRTVWVTTEGSRHVVAVDVATRRVARAIETGQQVTHMLALASSRGKLYTANLGSGTATVIDLAAGTVLRHIPTGAGAEGIAVTPDERWVLVTNREAGTLSVIDAETDQVVHEAAAGEFPIRVEVTPDGRRALVSDARAREVLEFHVGTWEVHRRLAVGAFPVGIEIAPGGDRAYVANTEDDRITELDLVAWRRVGTIVAGDEPDGMAYAVVR
ncbi:MAG: YncE family protein [Gemmatimonadota bacterium]